MEKIVAHESTLLTVNMEESCETRSGRDPFGAVVSDNIRLNLDDDVPEAILQVFGEFTGLWFVAITSGAGRVIRGDLKGERFLAGDVRAVQILT